MSVDDRNRAAVEEFEAQWRDERRQHAMHQAPPLPPRAPKPRRDKTSASERRLQGRIAALRCHAMGRTNTAPARAALEARFYEGIPESLPQEERDRRASYARKAYYAELALASVRSRAKRKAQLER